MSDHVEPLAQDVLQLMAAADKASTVVEAVKFMDQVYQLKEEIADLVKTPLEKLYDKLRFSVIPALMDAEEVTSLTIEGIGRVNLMDDVQTKVNNTEELQDWLVANGFEDMIKNTINAQTLNAFVRRRTKAGEQLPLDLITVTPVTRAQITRSN